MMEIRLKKHKHYQQQLSPYKVIVDSGFHAVNSGFQVLDFGCQWHLDSGFQSLVGFRIPRVKSHVPNPRIPHSTTKLFYSHYQAISVLPRRSKIDPQNINVLLLENVEEQNRNNEMPKGTRLGKTEQETAFR